MTKQTSPAASKAARVQPVRPVGAETQPGAGSPPAPGSANPNNSAHGASQPGDAKTGTTDRPTGGEPPVGASSDADKAAPKAPASHKLTKHRDAVNADVPAAVYDAACKLRPGLTDVLAARKYSDHWVLVGMTANWAGKVEVPHGP